MTLPRSTVTRRHIQIVLGLIWFLDGALQLQHQMFTSAFATQVIDPAAQGQPVWVGGPMHFFVHIFLMHPAIFNSLIAITQMGLGVLILWKRTAKWGLWASVLWGLFVWSVGEGYGGMFNGGASLLMGAPGAALLYLLLALAVLPSSTRRGSKTDEKHTSKQTAAFWLVIVWVLLWFGGMFWQLSTSGMNSVSGMKSMILSNAQSAPHWLATTDTYVAEKINSLGTYTQTMSTGQSMNMMQMAQMPTKKGSADWFTPTLAMLMVFISMGVVWRPTRKISLALGIVISLFFWVVGQSLGSYYTGTATDPNTGPLIVLLAIAIWGCTDLDVAMQKFLGRTEDILVGPDRS
jgi:hypothetical protein